MTGELRGRADGGVSALLRLLPFLQPSGGRVALAGEDLPVEFTRPEVARVLLEATKEEATA